MEIILEVKELTKRFGGLVAISNVDFLVRRGELVGIIGPNGAGKTTLFNLITAFLKPSQGSIFLKGENIGGRKPYELVKKGISRTFQIPTHFINYECLTT